MGIYRDVGFYWIGPIMEFPLVRDLMGYVEDGDMSIDEIPIILKKHMVAAARASMFLVHKGLIDEPKIHTIVGYVDDVLEVSFTDDKKTHIQARLELYADEDYNGDYETAELISLQTGNNIDSVPSSIFYKIFVPEKD